MNLYRSPYRDRFTLFVEGSALRYTTDDRVMTSIRCPEQNGCPAGESRDKLVDETIQWNEYTVLLGASGHSPGFKPYGGLRLSRVDGTDRLRRSSDSDFPDGFSDKVDLEEDDNFGIFGGVDIFLDRSAKTALNFEVSLFDQDSFHAAIRRQF